MGPVQIAPAVALGRSDIPPGRLRLGGVDLDLPFLRLYLTFRAPLVISGQGTGNLLQVACQRVLDALGGRWIIFKVFARVDAAVSRRRRAGVRKVVIVVIVVRGRKDSSALVGVVGEVSARAVIAIVCALVVMVRAEVLIV